MKSIEQKVLSFIKEHNLIKEGDNVLIALSGGPDSIFALHFFLKFKKKFKIKIGAAHVNHQLRGEDSERDELFCNAVCKEVNVPFFVMRANVKAIAKKNKSSLEITGRKIRYDFLEKISISKKYDKIITAHNSDDNTETVLLNLIKGAGIKGLSGIPIKRGKIIRPILCLSKEEILKYLSYYKFEYRIDKSNLSNDYERNILRNEIVPLIKKQLNPSFDAAVLNSSLILQRLNYFLEKMIEGLKSDITVKKDKFVSIPISLINNNDEFIVSQLIKLLFDETFNVKSELSDINKILLLKNKQVGKSEELTNNLIVVRERNDLIISKRKTKKYETEKYLPKDSSLKIGDKILYIESVSKNEIVINADKNIEFISADNIRGNFVIRKWQPADRFKPLGLKGTKKLSDYLTEIKIDSFTKQDQLVLLNDKKIIWVIGHRIDDRFKITEKTKKVLKLCLN